MTRSTKTIRLFNARKSCEIFAIIGLVSIILIGNLTTVLSRPYSYGRKPTDYDEDDIAEDASEDSPYNSQADQPNQNDGPNDGYEDSEPDSDKQYEESPADSENQNELERFFEDHLGASEREGMDKENLPTNAIPFVLENPTVMSESELKGFKLIKNGIDRHDNYAPITSNFDLTGAASQNYPKIEEENMYTDDEAASEPESDDEQTDAESDTRDSYGEDDKDDKVYIMDPAKPFVINQLDGYNPEEDFKAVSKDLEDSQSVNSKSPVEGNKPKKDIVFTEGDINGFSNEATETDDAAFEADDPYKGELIEDFKESEAPETTSKAETPDSPETTVDNKEKQNWAP